MLLNFDKLEKESEQFDVQDFHGYCLERGDAPYHYMNVHNCAISQYLKDRNICKTPTVGSDRWYNTQNVTQDTPYNEFPVKVSLTIADKCTFAEAAIALEKAGLVEI